jgi:hypothetical protein
LPWLPGVGSLRSPNAIAADVQIMPWAGAGAILWIEELPGKDLTPDTGHAVSAQPLCEVVEMSGGDCCGSAAEWDLSAYGRFEASGGRLVSAFVRARKP